MRTFLMLLLLFLSVGRLCGSQEYRVNAPEESDHIHTSPHFAVRWDDGDGVELSEEEIQSGLKTLESIWTTYINKVGFPPPYHGRETKFKADINVSDEGWATGSGTGERHPEMWVHHDAFQSEGTLAHEFAHCLQYTSRGFRDSPYVGWFWECHAEWMRHQHLPNEVGNVGRSVHYPYLYWGTTRLRYSNWLYLEYLKDRHGYDAVNRLWTEAREPGDKKYREEDPLQVIARTRGWSVSELNDSFGRWALQNATWNYRRGDLYRKTFGSYKNNKKTKRRRVTELQAVNKAQGQYRVPGYWAPQRYGYNLVRLHPRPGANRVRIHFNGLVQKKPNITSFPDHYREDRLPDTIRNPHSNWRWGIAIEYKNGKTTFSNLKRGEQGTVQFPVNSSYKNVWLVVTATPSKLHRIKWNQLYFSIYRYPWMVRIRGAWPEGHQPSAVNPPREGSGDQHSKGGGFVADSANVAPTAGVGPGAMVLGNATVKGQAHIRDGAIVKGNATVKGNAVVRDRAWVMGNTTVGESAVIQDHAGIYEGTVKGEARVGALTVVTNGSHIHGNARVFSVINAIGKYGSVHLSGSVYLLGDLELRTSLSKGVFSGKVDSGQKEDKGLGAERTSPPKQISKPLPALR